MQALCPFFLLAADYDEILLPSHFADFAPSNQRRNIAKALRYFVSRQNLAVFQRRKGETPNGWATRLEVKLNLGDFAECVSPPKRIRANNRRFYEGHSALVLMRTVGEDQIRITLSAVVVFSQLAAESNYTVSSILEFVPEPDKAALEGILKELVPFLQVALSLDTETDVFTGQQWRSFIPEGTLKKASSWLESPAKCPPFFGEVPEWIRALAMPPTATIHLPPIPEVPPSPGPNEPNDGQEEQCPLQPIEPDIAQISPRKIWPTRFISACLALAITVFLSFAVFILEDEKPRKEFSSSKIESRTYPFEWNAYSSNTSAGQGFLSAPIPPGS